MSVLPQVLRPVFARISHDSTECDFGVLLERAEAAAGPDLCGVPDSDRQAVRVELFALGVEESRRGAEKSVWGMFFGPPWLSGSIGLSEPSALSESDVMYLVSRSEEEPAPVLVARYADLAWELRRQSNRRVAIDVARRCIDARTRCARGLDHLGQRVLMAERALRLSIAVGDAGRSGAAADALVGIAEAAIPGIPSVANRVALLLVDCPDQMSGRWAALDAVVDRLAETTVRFRGDVPPIPNGDQILGNLSVAARYLGKRRGPTAVPEVLQRGVADLVCAVDRVDPSIASQWLELAIELCQAPGLRETRRELIGRLETVNRASLANMQSFVVRCELSVAERDGLVASSVAGTPPEVLARLIQRFLPTLQSAREGLSSDIQAAPLYHFIQRKFMDAKHVRAEVGGVADDLDGHLMVWLGEHLRWMQLALHISMEAVVRSLRISGRTFVGILACSSAFDVKRSAIVGRGFEHYLRGDYIAAIHLLVFQVEHFLRGILRAQAQTQSVQRDGCYEEIALGQLLDDPTIRRALGDDAVWYLRGLFDEKLCWNLRHAVAQ